MTGPARGGGSEGPDARATGRRTPERFDEELRRAARSLAVEPLPPEILLPSITGQPSLGGIRARRTVPGLATAATAIALLVVAMAVALSAGGPQPTASPDLSPRPSKGAGPLFRSTTDIVGNVGTLGYACGDGQPLPTGRSGSDHAVRESAICTTAKDVEPLFAAIIVAESAGRSVVRISFKADIVGEDLPASREAVAKELEKLVETALLDPGAAAAIGEVIVERLPELERAGAGVSLDLAGLHVSMARHETGTYIVNLVDPDAR
jgi:hypothetical protein